MIATIHGAFDSKTDLNVGISTLSQRLRELSLAQVRELNVDEWLRMTLDDLTSEPFVGIGYSNGMHQLMNILDAAFGRLTPAEVARTNVHIFCIDGVHFGGGMLAPRWHMGPYVRSCWNFMRTEGVGFAPWHQLIDKDQPPQFQTRFIAASHGMIPSAPEVQDAICDETVAIWKRYREAA